MFCCIGQIFILHLGFKCCIALSLMSTKMLYISSVH
uniref:Uncharacterized protein n=1 Tax=Anguilla anguilla TaxID=7936 RepID=A0A0E9UWJ2_ANGAN